MPWQVFTKPFKKFQEFAALHSTLGARSTRSFSVLLTDSRPRPAIPLFQSRSNMQPQQAHSPGHERRSSAPLTPRKGGVSFGGTTTIASKGKDMPLNTSGALPSRSRLRRSPTPLVHSLAELQREHADQLSRVWDEAGLPDPAADRAEISESLKDVGVVKENETVL